ncbi:MAG: hypothetical protein ACXW1O_02085 [Halobacteriota archaeon]
MKLLRAVLIVLIVAGLALACSGCTAKIENLTQNASQSSKGPTNVPEYPNANRTSYWRLPLAGQVMTYQTNGTPTQVLEFYKSQMQELGYNVSRSSTSTNETGGLILFAKGQDTVLVAVGKNNDQTSMLIRTSFQP